MANMAVELLLKLVDELSRPMGRATQSLEQFRQKLGEGKVKAADFFDAFNQQQNALDAYQKKLDGLQSSMAKLGQIQMGMHDAARTMDALGKPLADATKQAVEFEKTMESIARAAGRLDLKGKIGKDILDTSKKTNVPWQEIAEGERHLVALGGGEFLDKIAPVRERLARLTYASEAKAGDLYSMLERYMKLGGLSAPDAMRALEINYGQGKKGAYELKDMARGIPELFSMGRSLGMTGMQAATELPAVMQLLRQMSGTSGRADTMMRQGLKHLTDPHSVKRIQDELGVNVPEIRRGAVERGENPMLAIANAIADALKAGNSGEVNHKTGQIEGGDPEKLGSIAREYNFRSFIDAFAKMREQLSEFQTTPDEAKKQADADFASRAATTMGALERAAIANEQMAIKMGETQLETAKERAERKTKLYETATSVAESAPGVTGAALSAWNTLTNAGSMLAKAGEAVMSGAMLWMGAKYLGAKYPTLGAIGENALGAAKGVVKAPWDIAKGIGEGVSAEAPAAAAIGRGLLQTAGRGLLVGLLSAAGEYVVHKGVEALPHAGRSEEIERFANQSILGKIGELISSLAGAAVPAARAETMAPHAQAAPGAAETQAAPGQVDTSAIDQAKDKAATAGQEIKKSLDVTATPQVDSSSLDAFIGKLQQAASLLAALQSRANAAAASIARGSGALHDGFETR